MAEHAVLSPSSAHRWMRCPGSVRLTADLSEPEASPYALEGTMAHELCAVEASFAFGLISAQEYDDGIDAWRESTPDEYQEDMHRHAASYVALLGTLAGGHDGAEVMIEKRVRTGVDSCWGTADAIIVSDESVHVVDYKYGKGVRVNAPGNEQLRLYALGSLNGFGRDSATRVSMTIYQPRLDHVSTDSMSIADLRTWRDDAVAPQATLALGDNGPVVPSETACRWCPIAGSCKARADYMIRQDFAPAELMDSTELGHVLHQLPDIEHWVKAVRDEALKRDHVTGWKKVRSAPRRQIKDAEAAIDVFTAAGLGVDDVSVRKLKPLAALERATGGKSQLRDVLGELLSMTEGSIVLAPEDDSREEVDTAKEDFTA